MTSPPDGNGDATVRAGAFNIGADAQPDPAQNLHGDARAEGIDGAAAVLAERIGAIAQGRGLRVACAESLTGGLLASKLAQAPDASEWFRGGLVAYASQVKHRVLDVAPGPVVSERAVREMASGVARLLDADATVAVSGAAGPGTLEGNPPGTVSIATRSEHRVATELRHLAGDPESVCAQTCEIALRLLLELLDPES